MVVVFVLVKGVLLVCYFVCLMYSFLFLFRKWNSHGRQLVRVSVNQPQSQCDSNYLLIQKNKISCLDAVSMLIQIMIKKMAHVHAIPMLFSTKNH